MIILLVTSINLFADVLKVNDSGYTLVGRVGVGDSRGQLCSLAVTTSIVDIYSDRYEATFSVVKRKSNKWIGQNFSMQNYGGKQLFGSVQKYDSIKRIQKKLTISFFIDERTQKFKAIIHEKNLNAADSVGKFTVCENMVIR